MHTINVYSTHFFRALCLLFFGLMIGNVYGGGVKITVKGSQNGDPTYIESLYGDFHVFQNSAGGYVLEGEMALDLTLVNTTVLEMRIEMVPIYSDSSFSNSTFTTSLICEKVYNPFNEQGDIIIPIVINYEYEAIGYFLRVFLNKDNAPYRYFIPSVLSESARKAKDSPSPIVELAFKYRGVVFASFELEKERRYSYQIIDTEGVIYSSGVINTGTKSSYYLQVPYSRLPCKGKCYIVSIKGMDGINEPINLWKKFIPLR